MKRKTLKRKISIVGILVFVSMIVYSCWQDEWSSNVTDEVIFDSNKELTIAKAEQWYNATNPSATTVRSLSADGRIPAKPNWNKAKESKKGDLEVARQLGVKLPKWESQYERLYTDTKDCLKKLSRIYKIGVIANQSLGTSERLENLGVRKYIDLIIASAEEGVSKPDRRIFEIALERSCCKPENAVMIGDRIDNDIVPAKQLGMKTIWVKQGLGSLWNITDESEKADMEINNLSDVLKYL